MVELIGRGITKIFPDGTRALDSVSFHVRAGRILTLLGPSGCGKSTLLRIVAGLEQPSSGELRLDGEPFHTVPAGRRGVGFVFQNYALYPHLSVRENLTLSLRVQGVPREERDRRVQAAAEMLGILPLLSRKPAQLSGGQQQRVALGRALARQPRLYLLDEPLSNLDAQLRESMRAELKALFRKVNGTAIYVTHDQAEAMSLSDEIAVLRDGRILQVGPPHELYDRPSDLFVAGFVGSPRMNLWEASHADGALRIDGEPIAAAPPPAGHDRFWLGIRPEDVRIEPEGGDGGIETELFLAEPMGSATLLTMRRGSLVLRCLVPPGPRPDRLRARLPVERLHFFDLGDGRRLRSPADRSEVRA